MPTVGDQRVEMTAGPGIKKNVAHCFYLIVIFASFGYLKDFDCDEFLLVSSFPDFRRNTGLLGYSIVSRNRLEDEGCWQDPITTTDLAEMRKCPALQFNAKLFVRIQDLEAKTVGLDFVGNNIEGGYFTPETTSTNCWAASWVVIPPMRDSSSFKLFSTTGDPGMRTGKGGEWSKVTGCLGSVHTPLVV